MRGALLAAAVVVLLPAPALAEDLPVTGSWTQLRTSTPLGDSPDLQAQEGPALPVQNGPAGVVAFSAVRWSHAADLTLARVDSTSAASSPEVWACAAGAWPAGDRQPWSEHPEIDCTRHVVGTASGDRVTWRLQDLGPVDVLLVPGPGDTSAFSIAFGAPTADSFTVAPAPSPTVAPSPYVPPPAPETAAPVATVGLPPVEPVAPLPATSAAPAPVVPVRTPAPAPVVLAVGRGTPDAWPGQLLLAVLSVILVARAVFPYRPAVAPASLVNGEPR